MPQRLVAVGTCVVIAAAAAAGEPAVQLNHFPTGFDRFGEPLVIPAIDPAGIAWHEPTGHLFITDSEINEVPEAFAIVGANLFELSPAGDVLFAAYDLTALGNLEPTGITYNPLDGFFYVSNDDDHEVTRYLFDPRLGFAFDDVVDTLSTAGSADPEGIAADPATGLLYVVDGGGEFVAVYEHLGAFLLVDVLDLHALNDPADVPTDPEGIAVDPCTGNLLIVSDPDEQIYEFTAEGLFVARLDLSGLEPAVIAPQGLTVGPASAPGEPGALSIYVADGGIDNNNDPAERDGAVYEVESGCGEQVNSPPVLDPIPDQMVDELVELVLTATAVDPDPGDMLAFGLTGEVPEGAAIDPLTGQFTWTPTEEQGPGDYLITVQVTDDGQPPLSDETSFLVTVNEVNAPPVLDRIGDQEVLAGEVLTFTATATDPDGEPVPPPGLVAHWPFDSDFDSTTGSHHGTPAGGASIVGGPGEFILGGGALLLDGDDDHVSVGDVPLPGDLSVAAWVMPLNIDSPGNSGAVVLGDLDDDDWLRLETNGVRARFGGDMAGIGTDPDFVNGSWQHLVLVRSGGNLTLYRDGQPVGDGVQGAPFTPQLIGRKVSDHFEGLLDDVALWDRALQLDEIAFLYDGGGGNPADALGGGGTGLTFSLEGDVPPGAVIDPVTGQFTWTAPPSPVAYSFTVRVTDGGDPPASDEEQITVTVLSPCPADLDGDGMVGVTDMIVLLSAWGTDPGGPPDLDGDGTVGVNDLIQLLASWGPC